MVFIRNNQSRFYLFLRKNPVQHFVFWMLVFMVIYSYIAFQAWDLQLAAAQNPASIQAPSLYRITGESIYYAMVIGIPSFFIWLFYYQYRVQNYFALNFFSKRQINAWGFSIFFLVSGLTVFLLAFPITSLLELGMTIITPKWYENILVLLLFSLCNVGISYSKDTFEQYRRFERLRRQQQIDKQRRTEDELRFIKKQIRPHFLFNTLANLQILAKHKSDMLPDLMGQLSSLLRYLLYETNEEKVPLEKELDFLTSYVGLEKLQLSSKVAFNFEVRSVGVAHKKIAPMILLVFVENCFKHYNKGATGEKNIEIKLSVGEEELILETNNTYKENAQNEDNFNGQRKGVGLSSAKERLRLIYKDSYDLNIESKEGVFCLSLRLPLL